jgi:hypothetical protein
MYVIDSAKNRAAAMFFVSMRLYKDMPQEGKAAMMNRATPLFIQYKNQENFSVPLPV